MDKYEDRFWQIISEANKKSGTNDEKYDALKEILSNLNEEGLMLFQDSFIIKMNQLHTWDAVGAAITISDLGYSDDKFHDFKANVICLGKDVFDRAVSNLDSLSFLDMDSDLDIFYEGFGYLPSKIYEDKFNIEMPDTEIEPVSKLLGEPLVSGPLLDERLKRDYPKLYSKYNIEERFWRIISEADAKSKGNDEKHENLGKILSSKNWEDILWFGNIFLKKMNQLHTWDVRGAAITISGMGYSDDKFRDFKANIICRGKDVFYKAVSDPDSLSELDLDSGLDIFFEGFQSIPQAIYKHKFGDEFPLLGVESACELKGEPLVSGPLLIERIKRDFPKLFSKYYKDRD